MLTKEIRPKLEPDTCAVCGRRLLQGEIRTRFVAPDGARHIVCELCVARADRARWVREKEGEQPLGPRPVAKRRAGPLRRIVDWFGGTQPESPIAGDELAVAEEGRQTEAGRESAPTPARPRERRSRLPKLDVPQPGSNRPSRSEMPAQPSSERRTVMAVPTNEEAKLQRGLELFNHSQFPRTIAGLTRSLGLPQVAVLHAGGNSVEIFVAWGISWYSYRVDLGDDTEPVELSGRGNDSAELADVVGEWNVIADEGGVLMLKLAAITAEPEEPEEPETPVESPVAEEDA